MSERHSDSPRRDKLQAVPRGSRCVCRQLLPRKQVRGSRRSSWTSVCPDEGGLRAAAAPISGPTRRLGELLGSLAGVLRSSPRGGSGGPSPDVSTCGDAELLAPRERGLVDAMPWLGKHTRRPGPPLWHRLAAVLRRGAAALADARRGARGGARGLRPLAGCGWRRVRAAGGATAAGERLQQSELRAAEARVGELCAKMELHQLRSAARGEAFAREARELR
ncbi:unnamed protein product [Prorocentrum cordatum]|uniref:Uncharacterized protein n=1 Tax=Prorocentrum cordatum TaxID=2364126 RepID=A0ABN9Y8M9_9DINO|nr:unnamed protein product [Polarella glacialis]